MTPTNKVTLSANDLYALFRGRTVGKKNVEIDLAGIRFDDITRALFQAFRDEIDARIGKAP